MFYIGLFYVSCALAQRKNVLMLNADDYRPNMGIYGDANDPIFTSPVMVTPNLDALASKSLVLTRAYTQLAKEIEVRERISSLPVNGLHAIHFGRGLAVCGRGLPLAVDGT